MKLVLGSQNPNKVKEISQIFSPRWETISVAHLGITDEPPEEGKTFLENALQKGLYFSNLLPEEFLLAEDSGLEVEALKGAPGIYSKRYCGEDGDSAKNNQKLLSALEGLPPSKRRAQFRCTLVLVKGGELLFTGEGICRGFIGSGCLGEGGFGYDPLFIYPPWNKTFGEAPQEKKNRVSHRFLALRTLKEFLETGFWTGQ